MVKSALFIIPGILLLLEVNAQSGEPESGKFAIETRVTNYLQSGYDLSAFYYLKGKFSIGLQAAGSNIAGRSKEIVFNSSAHDQLDIRLNWVAAIKARYHLARNLEGLYAELNTGIEQFTVKSAEQTQRNKNGFISLGIGYIWYPWGRKGIYVNPNSGFIFIYARGEEKSINNIKYQLKSFFPSPALSIGWKF